jgi:hypothetical protein
MVSPVLVRGLIRFMPGFAEISEKAAIVVEAHQNPHPALSHNRMWERKIS